MLDLARFINIVVAPGARDPFAALPRMPPNIKSCLLFGKNASIRSTLAFHCAFDVVSSGHGHVLVVSLRDGEHRTPLLPHGIHMKDPRLHQIRYKYLPTLQSLQQFAACLHLSEDPPTLLIVDGLSAFAARADEKRAKEGLIKTLALLQECVQVLRPLSGLPCLLVVTDSGAEEGPRSLRFIFARWLQLLLHVQGDTSQFSLSVHPSSPAADLLDPITQSAEIHFTVSSGGTLVVDDILCGGKRLVAAAGKQQDGDETGRGDGEANVAIASSPAGSGGPYRGAAARDAAAGGGDG